MRNTKLQVEVKVNGKVVKESVEKETKEVKQQRGSNGRFVKGTAAAEPVRKSTSAKSDKKDGVADKKIKEEAVNKALAKMDSDAEKEQVSKEAEEEKPDKYAKYTAPYEAAVKGGRKANNSSGNKQKMPKRKPSLSEY